jgi:hypothetical protein
MINRSAREVCNANLSGCLSEAVSVTISETGTLRKAQLLANIHLQYTLDIWFERIYRGSCCGYARLIRYTDAFIVCFHCKAMQSDFDGSLSSD